MERMNPYEFANLLCIFAQMDGRCADKTIRPRQMSFIEVESASDSTKKYEPICIDDIYVEYLYDRMDARQAAEEAINRIINAKEVVTKKAPEGPKAMHIMNIDSNHVLDILNRIMHDADNMPSEEPEEPEEPATPVVQPVLTRPVMSKKESPFDDMLSALEDEDEEETDDTSAAPESNESEKPDASGDLYNAFDDDEDSDLLSALENEDDDQDEQKPAESDNDETEEEPEETQEEAPEETQEEEPEETQKEQSDGLSLDESNGEPDDTEEGQEKESVAVDIEQEMKDAFAKILNFKYWPSSSEDEEAKEIFDTLVKGASRNFFAKPASIKYDVKEEAKKPVNPNGNVSLGDVIAAALGMPEAGKLDTDTGDTGDDFDL